MEIRATSHLKIVKFDEFLAQQGSIDQDFGPSRFLFLDFGPLVKKLDTRGKVVSANKILMEFLKNKSLIFVT
jgi:hypothetical protein